MMILSRIVCRIRSYLFSRYIDNRNGKIVIVDPWLRFKIKKQNGAKLIVIGTLKIVPHLEGRCPTQILLSRNSIFSIDGDFIIGDGVKIFLNENAEFKIGGRRKEKASGITANTLIMVYNKITIGYDFMCAWNIFISDSNWHKILGQEHHANVEIGDHVWLANSCSILKGTKIGDGSIVASHSKLINKEFPAGSIIAGIPAKTVKSDVSWTREI